MIIVKIKNGENIESSLKSLKSKVIRTKQNQLLLNRKEFKSPSEEKRLKKQKAIYTERMRKLK